jgi:threonylcarbamoyladenosine tRNA methylthiotransferase MtaB
VEALLGLKERGLARLRLSSIEPMDFDESLAGLASSDSGLCPHFHLPLQSADDEVLERMRRPYRLAGYRALLERLRLRVPEVAVTTDIIAGFPGEGEAAHARTVDFVREAGFARVHAFPFSPRPGTAAAGMPGMLPREEARRRTKELIEAGGEAALAYRSRFVGKVVRVLAERGAGDGTLAGYSERYVRVAFRGDRSLVGSLVGVRATSCGADGLAGEVAG